MLPDWEISVPVIHYNIAAGTISTVKIFIIIDQNYFKPQHLLLQSENGLFPFDSSDYYNMPYQNKLDD